jgi:phage-related protein
LPMDSARLKQVVWMGDSLALLRQFPREVQREIGHAIYLAQVGGKHTRAKPLKGFGPGVWEVLSDESGDTFRAVYTVRLAGRIYVLHVFQKKSKKGIATPLRELWLVKQRLKRAEEIHYAQEDKDAG